MRRGITAALLALLFVAVIAAPCFAGVHATAICNAPCQAVYYDMVIQAMDAKWSTTNNTRFVLHTGWVLDADGSWIENGFMDGAHRTGDGKIVYWHGFYNAAGRMSGGSLIAYEENTYTGPSTTIGTKHTFTTMKSGTGEWSVYVDGSLVHKYYLTDGTRMEAGLETNDQATTSATWSEQNFMMFGSGGWEYWKGGFLNNQDGAWGLDVQWVTAPKTDGSVAPAIKTSKT